MDSTSEEDQLMYWLGYRGEGDGAGRQLVSEAVLEAAKTEIELLRLVVSFSPGGDEMYEMTKEYWQEFKDGGGNIADFAANVRAYREAVAIAAERLKEQG